MKNKYYIELAVFLGIGLLNGFIHKDTDILIASAVMALFILIWINIMDKPINEKVKKIISYIAAFLLIYVCCKTLYNIGSNHRTYPKGYEPDISEWDKYGR